MKLINAILMILVVVNAVRSLRQPLWYQVGESDYWILWKAYKVVFKKIFRTNTEEAERFKAFKNTVDFVYKHNQGVVNNASLWGASLNDRADSLPREKQSLRGLSLSGQWLNFSGFKGSKCKKIWNPLWSTTGDISRNPDKRRGRRPPEQWDWRAKDCVGRSDLVTPVRDQKDSGLCFSFAAMGALETPYIREISPTDSPPWLSVMQGGVCRIQGHCGTSDSGGPDEVFTYVCQTGVLSERQLPFGDYADVQRELDKICATDATDGAFCAGIAGRSVFDIEGYFQLAHDIPGALLAIWKTGPIAAGISTHNRIDTWDGFGWPFDDGGNEGSDVDLDHAVVLVGWDITYDPDYPDRPPSYHWIVKNSWGTNANDEGYIRVKMGTNVAGIEQFLTQPISKKDWKLHYENAYAN